LANAKSSTQSHRLEERATVAEITELEERTEVANVQAEVWAAVMQDDYLDDETRAQQMARLESKLMDVQEVR
jgi:aminoglycoside N3'-acetyltransferase